jgi:LDH2 family malate/lactate/ureidoglycolate dehydrogenase
MVICKEDVLKTLAVKRLGEAGMPEQDAAVVADILV